MRKKLGVRSAVVAALLAAYGVSTAAFAVPEVEPNDTIDAAQDLLSVDGGTVEVNGVIGVESYEMEAIADVDFFSFEGKEGDVVTLDIDGGMKPGAAPDVRHVDTYIAVFGQGFAGPLTVLDVSQDEEPVDLGSAMREDARIDNFTLPKTGKYWVGVSSFPRELTHNGFSTSDFLDFTSNGRYTLLISWAAPTMQHVNIEVRPGSKELAFINPKAKGSIPVALLSSEKFKPLEVDQESLTFGAKGGEKSLVRCNKNGADLNHDGTPDLLCHFDSQVAGFQPGDTAAHIKGKKNDGKPFQGRGNLKAVIEKRKKR
jgi:hypothetical protein